MTITNGYTTLTAIKAHKDISSVNAVDDAVIEDIVEAASRYIDRVTGRRFYTTSVDETRTFRAAGPLRCYPWDLLSVTTLKTDDDGDRTYETTWATTDYDLLPSNAALDGMPYTIIQVTPDGANDFPPYEKSVQIVGKFGYSSTTPADIEMACRLISLRMYQNRFGLNPQGAATITAAGVVITPEDIPDEALLIIRGYARVS